MFMIFGGLSKVGLRRGVIGLERVLFFEWVKDVGLLSYIRVFRLEYFKF